MRNFCSPLVFYVPNAAIVESNSDDIFYIESIYTLLLCMNLSPLKQKEPEVSWIMCEVNKEV